tara:strand:+ start:377 stop:4726 length:4350 start_codon:yes stop_codon:yes gene_type:complete
MEAYKMEGKMNVVVIMMLAFVGFAASGAVIVDGVDTLSPDTVFSYEDTHPEVVGNNYLEVELKRTDHYDIVEMAWYSSWKGTGKGFVARSRLGSRLDKTTQTELGVTDKWRPFGRGRYVRQRDLTHLVPKLVEKAREWGAEQRDALTKTNKAQAKVAHAVFVMKRNTKLRKQVQVALERGRRIMRVDDEGRRLLAKNESIREYGATNVHVLKPPADDEENANMDDWVCEDGYRWHKPTEDDLDKYIVIERESKEVAETAWKAYVEAAGFAWDNIVTDDVLQKGIQKYDHMMEAAKTPEDWDIVLDHSKWTHTFEHEAYYLNHTGIEAVTLASFIRDNLQAKFKAEGIDVRVHVSGCHGSPRRNDDYERIDMFNIDDDVSLGHEAELSDWLNSDEEYDSHTDTDVCDIRAMNIEINFMVGDLKSHLNNLRWYFKALANSYYPMASVKGMPPVVVGPKGSNHHHVSVYGLGDGRKNTARDKFRKLMQKDWTNPERRFMVAWMSTVVTNWVWNWELFEGTMPYSRRSGRQSNRMGDFTGYGGTLHEMDGYGGTRFAAHVSQMEERISAARSLTQYAEVMGQATDPEDVKAEFAGLMAHWTSLWEATNNSRHRISDDTWTAFDDWDGTGNPPSRLTKLVRTSLKKWDDVFFHEVERDRESQGDGHNYASLNIHALFTRGTIEFRQFGQSNNWKNIYQTMIQLQSLLAISKVGMPVYLTNDPSRAIAQSNGHLTGNGALAMARLMTDTCHNFANVDEFMEARGIKALSELNYEAIGESHLMATKGAGSVSWRGRNDLDYADDDLGSVSTVGFGLAWLLGLAVAVSPIIAALTMLVGCGIAFYVNMNRLHNVGMVDDVRQIQPRPPTSAEVKGLLKMVPALAHRGEQGFGIGKLHEDGRITACWEVRNPPEEVTTYYGGRTSSYTKKDTTNVPKQRGSLSMRALNGGYNLSDEDYNGLVYIAHTRFSTGGTSDKLNAHPHYVGAPIESDVLIGVFGQHNGVVYNDRESMAHLPKHFLDLVAPSLKGLDVDSRAIWANLAYYGSDNDGIDMMAKHTDGSMRLMWFDRSEKREGFPPRLHLWSNTKDLWIAELTGPEGGRTNYAGASTAEILREQYGDAIIDLWEAELYHHYVVDYQLGIIDMGPCGETDDHWGADDWKSGSSGKNNKSVSDPFHRTTLWDSAHEPAKPTNTKPSSVAKQLGVPGSFRQHINEPVDPNFDGDCAHCEDGDLLYGSLEQCPECKLTLDDVMESYYATVDASCSVKSACSSPTKATPEAVEDLGIKALFDDRGAGTSSSIPPVGSGKQLKEYVDKANKAINHPVDICKACNRPPETCDADPCVVETARRSRELGLSIIDEQKTKKSNPQANGFVVMRKCDDKLCCGMEQPHERTGHNDNGTSIFECMGPCGWAPTEASQKLKDWIDNELAGGNTINVTALSAEGQAYLQKRLSEGGNLA